jgi:hypothetical protein
MMACWYGGQVRSASITPVHQPCRDSLYGLEVMMREDDPFWQAHERRRSSALLARSGSMVLGPDQPVDAPDASAAYTPCAAAAAEANGVAHSADTDAGSDAPAVAAGSWPLLPLPCIAANSPSTPFYIRRFGAAHRGYLSCSPWRLRVVDCEPPCRTGNK